MKFKIIIISVCVIGLLIFAYFQTNNNKQSETLLYLNHHDSVQYLGVDACKDCHLDKYETFVETGMGRSFHDAELLNSAARFKNITPVYDSFIDLYYLPFAINNNIYIKEFRLNGKDTIYSRTEKIKYIVGSGHHTNSHLIEENGFLFQAPLTFYTQKGQWDLPPGFENGQNTRFSRKIGLECMSCHNALPEYNHGSDNQFAKLAHGISCERCHGPGQVHVQRMRKGEVVDIQNETDFSIVNPRKLNWSRQIDICQRCHLQGNAVIKPGKTFLSFKPGMKLSESFDQFSPEYEGEDNFVMAAHAERFQKSLCFIKSTKGDINSNSARIGFTCISCHNPHVSVRSTNVLQYNKVCQSCHLESKQLTTCSAPKNQLLSAENNCVKCHMPSSGTSDIPHVTVHDHYIQKNPIPKSGNGKLKGLRCITNPNPDLLTETQAYISYFEKFEQLPLYINKANDLAKKMDIKQLEHLKTLIHLHYVQQDFSKIIKLSKGINDLKDDWSNYRVAKSYESKGEFEKALQWMGLIIDEKKPNIDFMTQYANLLIKTNAFNKAEKILLSTVQLYAKNADVYAMLGFIALKNNQLSELKKYSLKALTLDPDLVLALNNLKLLYTQTQEIAKLEEIEKRLKVIEIRYSKSR
ncbi:MAG: tetratricopeptide repeat protein [Bacteroidota bacterium]|nr:tetratricopeptide repeat protein [Bacteroidota bacterium]